VWRPASNFTKALELLQDGICGCNPDEQYGMGVVLLPKSLDLAGELSDGFERVAF